MGNPLPHGSLNGYHWTPLSLSRKMGAMTTKQSLEWRYATKKFDTEKELPVTDLDYILECGNLAATSFGLQPFGIVAVTDEAKKAELMAAAYGQEHVGNNGALLVLCARTDVDEAFITEFTTRMEQVRGLEAGSVDGYKDMMVGTLTSKTAEEVLTWSQKQAYIVLGTLMVAAAEKMVDGCPLEGFDPAAFNEILGLSEHNLHATNLLALGYRSAEDTTQHYAKVRKDLEDVVVRI
jgi:nitroreductase/dihydropteridine reductase